MVEDTPSGIEAACRAKMAVLAVTNTHPADTLGAADHVIDVIDADTWTELTRRSQAGRSATETRFTRHDHDY